MADERVSVLPAGTLTFLVTDVEADLIKSVVSAHGGTPPSEHRGGNGAIAVFASAIDAVAAALDLQQGLSKGECRPRVAVHTGAARLDADGHFTGTAVERTGRLRDVAYPGQTLLSSVTASVVSDALSEGARLSDLGAHRLRDLAPAERVFEVCRGDVPGDSRRLRSLDAVPNNLPVQLTSFVGRSD